MAKSTKYYGIRILFWGAIIAAPFMFFSMGLIYLNAWLTGDRVNFAAIPVFEVLSNRSVQIETTQSHIGFNTSFDFRSIDFFKKDATLDPSYTPVETQIGRLYIQFKTLTLLARTFQVDSILIDTFSGILKYNPDRPFSRFEWVDEDESRRMEINLDRNDLGNIHIKSFRVQNSDIHYVNEALDEAYLIEDFYQDLEVEGIRVMNMLLVNGNLGGTFKNPGTKSRYADFNISGRLQLNFDDRTFLVRNGRLVIDDEEFSYTAFLNNDTEAARFTIIFNEPQEIIEQAFQKLPPSLEQWLYEKLPESRYQVQINYSGEHAEDQT